MALYEIVNQDSAVLKQLRALPELTLHKKIVKPLLEKLHATHITYTHGSQERGKDFTYIDRDLFNIPHLCVCQVKNFPFSGRASDHASTEEVLRQLNQCRKRETLNPITHRKERPHRVTLLTTHSLADKDLSDGKTHLEELRDLECQIVGPDQLLSLIKEHLPDIYQEFAFPGQGLGKAIRRYLNVHHEAAAFDIVKPIGISDFYVNLGSSCLTKTSPIFTSDRKSITTGATLNREEYQRICNIIDLTFPAELATVPPVVVSEESLRKRQPTLPIDKINILAFIEHVKASVAQLCKTNAPEDMGKALYLMVTTGYIVRDLFTRLSQHPDIRANITAYEAALSELRIPEAPPDSFLYFHGNVCITAGAGAGKTCFARMLAQKALDRGQHCVYFPCARIHNGQTSLTSAIADFLKSIVPDASLSALDKYVAKAQLIILDGCDEAATFGDKLGDEINSLLFKRPLHVKLPATNRIKIAIPSNVSKKFTYDSTRRVLSLMAPASYFDFIQLRKSNLGTSVETAIDSLLNKYSDSIPRLILTSRSIDSLSLQDVFTSLSLNPFDDQQLNLFFEKYFRSGKKCHEDILTFMDSNPYVKEFSRVPMNATLIAAFRDNNRELPRSKAELYTGRFDLLLHKWDTARGVKKRNVVHPNDKFFFLMRLALVLHLSHRRTFTKRDLARVWKQGLYRRYPQLSVDELILELQMNNSVIHAENRNEFSLGHLSYQEFLAAHAIMRQQLQSTLIDHWHDEWWKGVIIFYAGVCGDVSSLLRAVQNAYGLDDKDRLLSEMSNEARFTSPVVQDFLADARLNDMVDGDDIFEEEEAGMREELLDEREGIEEDNDDIEGAEDDLDNESE